MISVPALGYHRSFAHTSATQLASTPSPIMIEPDFATTSITTQPQFEPVLNVPAFSVFLLVAAIFAALQWRISAIGKAAEERTAALDRLRRIKAAQLTSDADADAVRAAVRAYEDAYWRVERLRTVIPGVARVAPPPSQSVNRRVMDENAAAARQFLGIEPETTDQSDESESEEKRLSPVLAGVLAVIALSQIALLVLLVATDPVLTSVVGGGGGGGGDSLLDSVVDAVSGLE